MQGEGDHELYLESQPLAEGADPDRAVITDLAQIGSNIAKPHLMEFFLYFPHESEATKAAVHVAEEGFQVNVAESVDASIWRVIAAKTMFPQLAALQQIRADFTALASSLNGEYDGWETEVTT